MAAAGVVIVPATGVECVALEVVDALAMAGSFGRFRGPVQVITKRAFMASPRSVWIVQRAVASSQVMPVTQVWKQALS